MPSHLIYLITLLHLQESHTGDSATGGVGLGKRIFSLMQNLAGEIKNLGPETRDENAQVVGNQLQKIIFVRE